MIVLAAIGAASLSCGLLAALGLGIAGWHDRRTQTRHEHQNDEAIGLCRRLDARDVELWAAQIMAASPDQIMQELNR